MIAIGISAVTGLAYATYRIYNDVINNDRYTLSELREEVPESESIITRDEALNKINYYLSVLGEEKVSADELKLVRYIKTGEIYWKFENENNIIQIKSDYGNLVTYTNANLHENKILESITIEELYKKLNLSDEYELCNDRKLEKSRLIEYAKKYGDIYNKYESAKFSIYNDNIEFISIADYEYEDTDILISQEKALEIATENGIEVVSIEMSIENVTNTSKEYLDNVYEELEYDNIKNELIQNTNMKIKKVWKMIDKRGSIKLIDVLDGKIFSNLDDMYRPEGE